MNFWLAFGAWIIMGSTIIGAGMIVEYYFGRKT